MESLGNSLWTTDSSNGELVPIYAPEVLPTLGGKSRGGNVLTEGSPSPQELSCGGVQAPFYADAAEYSIGLPERFRAVHPDIEDVRFTCDPALMNVWVYPISDSVAYIEETDELIWRYTRRLFCAEALNDDTFILSTAGIEGRVVVSFGAPYGEKEGDHAYQKHLSFHTVSDVSEHDDLRSLVVNNRGELQPEYELGELDALRGIHAALLAEYVNSSSACCVRAAGDVDKRVIVVRDDCCGSWGTMLDNGERILRFKAKVALAFGRGKDGSVDEGISTTVPWIYADPAMITWSVGDMGGDLYLRHGVERLGFSATTSGHFLQINSRR